MKRLIIILTLIIPLISSGQQSNIMSKMNCYELRVDGIDNFERGDYLIRSLEKMNLVVCGSFSLDSQQVYLLLSDKNQMSNISTYIDNALNGYKLRQYEEVPLSEELFLKVYELRNGVEESEISKSKPEYIQLGPKTEISNTLYKEAIRIWEKQYGGEHREVGYEDFANRGMQNEYYIVKFEIDKPVDKQKINDIYIALKESDKITDVNVCGEGCYEIYSYEEIYPEYVEDIISQYGVNISERSLKEKK